jgi:predicted kinase
LQKSLDYLLVSGKRRGMAKVTICKGLPASGKSTWARAEVEKHPGTIKRVNKDELRAMLDLSRWSKPNEKFVEKLRDFIIVSALTDGLSVIIDDTNLHPRHEARIRELVSETAPGTHVEVKFFEIELEEAIKRDLKRPVSVGEKVIRDMWNTFLAPKSEPIIHDPALPNAVVVDLDGTLALMVARGPFDAAKCETDMVNEVVRGIMLHHDHVLLMSGRSDEFRPQTERWLVSNNIAYRELHMRAQEDKRKDSIVKRELFDAHVRGRYNVSFVLDDRQQVVDMWRSLGLVCLQVAPGDF